MPSPLPRRSYLQGECSPSVDARPCSSPSVLPGRAGGKLFPGATPPRAPRLPRRLAWCTIDWEQLRLLQRLGAGGFGCVHKATYRGALVAVKQVNRCAKNRLASQRSFWAELNVARLRHENIVGVVAASTRTPAGLDSLGTIIMEFGGHVTLHQVIYGAASSPEEEMDQEEEEEEEEEEKEEGGAEEVESHGLAGEELTLPTCLKYALDIANGLLFLHAQGIVHLDLKPANVLISERGVCKIGDFGCSERLGDLPEGAQAAAPSHPLGGTYTHRAPELLRGEGPTPKADIYSFAITLWQMATREAPFPGERQHVLYAVVAYQLRPPLSAAVFAASDPGRRLAALIRGCWAARAPQRPSAQLLLADLAALRAELAPSEPVSR